MHRGQKLLGMPARAKKGKAGAKEGGSTQLSLQITPLPSQFPFVDKFFELPVFLVDSSGNPRTGMAVPLSITLLSADGEKPAPRDDLLVLDPAAGAPAIGAQGQARIRLKLTDVSMHHNNQRFILRVAPTEAAHAPAISEAKTEPLTVVRHRLEILDQPPEVWFKDEGGRDKCITLHLRMVDAVGACVTARTVPLKIELTYESGELVLNQGLLKIPGDAKRSIDTSTGKGLLRLRIEDVSKNHQGQSFRIRVAPDTAKAPLNHDISWDATSKVAVRSKRNKRRVDKGEADAEGAARGRGGGASSSSGGGHRGGGSSARPPVVPQMVALLAPAGAGVDVPAGSVEHATRTALSGVMAWTGQVVEDLQSIQQVLDGVLSNYVTHTQGHLQTLVAIAESGRMPGALVPGGRGGAAAAPASAGAAKATEDAVKGAVAGVAATAAAVQSISSAVGAAAAAGAASSGGSGSGPMTASGGNPTVAAAWNAGVTTPRGGHAMPPPSRETSLGAPPASGPALGMTRSMDEAIKGLPELLRGGSFGFGMDFGGGAGAVERNASMGASAPPQLGRGVSGGWVTRAGAAADQNVFFIVARMFNCAAPLGELGLPAFDRDRVLLGFYQEAKSDAATEVLFVALADLPAQLTDGSKDAAKQLLGSELEMKSDAVFRLSRHNNDLVKLKEDALMFYWTSNLGDSGVPILGRQQTLGTDL